MGDPYAVKVLEKRPPRQHSEDSWLEMQHSGHSPGRRYHSGRKTIDLLVSSGDIPQVAGHLGNVVYQNLKNDMKIKHYIKRAYQQTFPNARLERGVQADRELKALNAYVDDELLAEAKLLSSRMSLLERLPKNAVCCEVGVSMGVFADAIARVTQPKKMYLIDAWHMEIPQFGDPAFQHVKSRFSDEIENGTVNILRGWSVDMLNQIPDGALDWIYIDAGHEYHDVLADLAAAASKVKIGGLVCGHDYAKWGRKGARMGVVEAVNQFSMKNRYPFRYITMDSDTSASFALTKVD